MVGMFHHERTFVPSRCYERPSTMGNLWERIKVVKLNVLVSLFVPFYLLMLILLALR